MLARFGSMLARFFRATAPDPFVLAILLTLLTFGLALVWTDATPRDVVAAWSGTEGIWASGLLAFALQMCLILVAGHALASAPLMARVLKRLAAWPNSAKQAIGMVALCAAALGVMNWGLGLIAGAILARETGRAMERKGVRVHYPLLAAAGYVGLMVWHGGFSGSAPLTMTDPKFIATTFGAGSGVEPLKLSQTLLSPLNFVVTGGLLVIAPLVLALMSPKADECHALGQYTLGEGDGATRVADDPGKPMLPRLLEDTPIVTVLLLGALFVWAFGFYAPGLTHALTGGAFGDAKAPSGINKLGLNEVILTLLMLGLVLHATPRRYAAAIADGAGACGGILLQFPLYFGILGVMKLGLVDLMAREIADIAGPDGLPVATFVSAGVVNMFVPSGGGQWAIQGPIALKSAQDAGIPLEKMVMAVAYGDQLTNMLQPFWALPLLAITGVKAREIVGYTAVLMVAAALWIGVWLWVM
ncbi:MAG: short-chain fatty acid transporter [Phycisphaerales bacterium]|nr:short-chain fatty acid transporter [Phycisphaerales bacterium]